MGDSPRNPGKDNPIPQTSGYEGQGPSHSRLVDWQSEPSKSGRVHETLKLADDKAPGSDRQPPNLAVTYDSAKGLDKPVGPDVQHLTINSPKGINLATNLIYGQKDTQGREIPPYFHTVIGEPGAKGGVVLRGQFDVSPNLQDVTIKYKDDKGVEQTRTYPASALRVEGAAGAINPYVNDFRKPEDQRPVTQQYPGTTSVYEFGYRMSDISSNALGFLERQLLNDKKADKTNNPYIDINLAEVRVGLGMQHYMNSFNGRYSPEVRAQEKQYALHEIEEARKNYSAAVDLSQKQMKGLPNPGSMVPWDYTRPMGRRYAPTMPYGDDYYPLVFGSAMDTANWRKAQLDLLQGMMSVNGQLPRRQSKPGDQP